jgi:hypothetical protein
VGVRRQPGDVPPRPPSGGITAAMSCHPRKPMAIRAGPRCRRRWKVSGKFCHPRRQSFPAADDPAHGTLAALPTNQLAPSLDSILIRWGGVLSFTFFHSLGRLTWPQAACPGRRICRIVEHKPVQHVIGAHDRENGRRDHACDKRRDRSPAELLGHAASSRSAAFSQIEGGAGTSNIRARPARTKP